MEPSTYEALFPHKLRTALQELLQLPADYASPADWLQLLERGDSSLEACEVLVTSWGMPPLDDQTLAQLPSLQAIFHAAGSVKFIQSSFLWERGITVVSAAEANAIPVVEYCLGTIFFSLKLGWQQMKRLRTVDGYARMDAVPGSYKSKIGIISFSTIGQLLAKRLRATDLACMVYDPLVPSSRIEAVGAQKASLEEVFGECELVSLQTPLLAETRHMVGEKHILSMKNQAVLLNTSRGEIIDQPGMIKALKARPDLTAVLDVAYPEPLPKNHPLLTLDNIILTPHIAGSLGTERLRLSEFILEAMREWLAGQQIRGEVSHQKFLTMA